jgi:hypothetical protein
VERIRTTRASSEAGSVLLLIPACVLVVIVLASIATDMALAHLRQRQAFDLAGAAANDAVTAGVDQDLLRSGTYDLDPAAVRATVDQAVMASELSPHVVGRPQVTVDDDRIEVSIEVEVEYLFTGAIPGAPGGATVTATASAAAVQPMSGADP